MSGSAARGAAGYLYHSGRLRNRDSIERRQREAERAAELLKRERETTVVYRKRKALEPA